MKIGDRVAYFPIKKDELDNRHPLAMILGFTATGRVQIVYYDPEGEHKVTVSRNRLGENQGELLG